MSCQYLTLQLVDLQKILHMNYIFVENNNALGKDLYKSTTLNCLLDLHKRFVFLILLIYITVLTFRTINSIVQSVRICIYLSNKRQAMQVLLITDFADKKMQINQLILCEKQYIPVNRYFLSLYVRPLVVKIAKHWGKHSPWSVVQWYLMWNANSVTGVQFPVSANYHVMLTLGKSTLPQPRWPSPRLAIRY